MLASEIISRVRQIQIRTGRPVADVLAGEYVSVFRGSGIEFEEVREYTAGDEVKAIDWKVSARMGRPYVKRYREERELIVILLVDMSASGRFGVGENLKMETAAEIAKIFTEVVIAPEADSDARAILAEKQNLRLLVTGALPDPAALPEPAAEPLPLLLPEPPLPAQSPVSRSQPFSHSATHAYSSWSET